MTKRMSFAFILLLVIWVIPNGAQANVWIDEDFEDGVAFGPSGVDTDPYSFNALANPIPITATGQLSNERAYLGSTSYKISAGEGVTISEPFQDPANGPFQYIQFAVSLGEIPSTPGTFAELRWNWLLNLSVDHSFYIQFQSDGSEVTMVAGEDLAGSTSGVLGTFTDANTWKYITIQLQKNATPENDSRAVINQSMIPQGAYFYASSSTPQVVVSPAIGTPDSTANAKDWSLTVTDGSLFIDEVYYEGAMTDALDGTMGVPVEEANRIRALDSPELTAIPPSSVFNWKLFD
ncbi:MAG: hypothetical protein KC978_22895 [Candidatus Omnitrophica bacterium]|nr:hypothetical protein [Candidatus Omnitrophota bacterium]